MQQKTLGNAHIFEGKGLHTGTVSRMKVLPAPADSGIVFRRTDCGAEIPAIAANVSDTSRSTTLSAAGASVHTVEHIMSALTGMGIDNAIVEIDNVEVPILDGSARLYAEAFAADGLVSQDAPRRVLTLPRSVEVRDEKTGSWVRLTPAQETSYSITVDFGSKVLGVQQASLDSGTDYAREIAVCRTFVFFHEIEFLFANNLIKGGDVDNAIVIVEHPVSDEQLDRISRQIGKPRLEVTPGGYLSNLSLHFPNECGRHKLLDLVGDLRLAGWPAARIEAFKPGHKINTMAAKAVADLLK